MLFKSRIEKLSRKHQKLTALRENKSQEYLNRATKDYEDTQRVVTNIDHKIDKVIRDMGSEKIYVENVTNQETKEYLANNAAKTPTNLTNKNKYETKESVKTTTKTKKETK